MKLNNLLIDVMVLYLHVLYIQFQQPILRLNLRKLPVLLFIRVIENRIEETQILHFLEEKAQQLQIQQLFVLTTRTAHWFIEHGFTPATSR